MPVVLSGFFRVMCCTTFVVLACLWSACVEVADDPRAALLQERLIDDNRPLLEREPDLTFRKFAKMARSRYEFLRGTPAVFLADHMEAGVWPSAYATRAGARVVTIGDAHPENIGTYRSLDETLLLDFNDFDGVTWGPWHIEVRRLALGWSVLAIDVFDDEDEPSRVRAAALGVRVVEGYLQELDAQAAGEAPLAVRVRGRFGPVVQDLFGRAQRNGRSNAHLLDYTELVQGRRVLRTGTLRSRDGVIPVRELWPITEAERQIVASVIERWPNTVYDPNALGHGDWRIVDIRRRVGAGVTSLPILRYYVLLQGPSDDPDDVLLLDVKEARDGALWPGLYQAPFRPIRCNAERTVLLQRAFQEVPDADPLLGWACLDSLSFRVQDLAQWQKGIDSGRIRANVLSNDWTWGHIEDLAALTGRLLARGHLRASTLDGSPAGPAIRDALGGHPEGFVRETEDFLERYLVLFLADYRRFLRLLDDAGPLLGYRVAGFVPRVDP
jgi:uncharacterized protein (DUF2252 family)